MTSPFSWLPNKSQIEATSLHAFLVKYGLTNFEHLVTKADGDPAWFWDAVYKHYGIQFVEPYRSIVEYPNGPELPRWCVGGKTNAVTHCIDRHRGGPEWDKPALIGLGEDGSRKSFSYKEFDDEVCNLAALLKNIGVGKGDVVAIHLPMIPEAAFALFAIMKIGAVALPLFSGFGWESIAARLSRARARAIVTVDATLRRGKLIPMLDTALKALEMSESSLKIVALDRGLHIKGRPGSG